MFQPNPNRPTRTPRTRRAKPAFVLAIALLLATGSQRIRAAETYAPTESQVKAAMIYNFAQYVKWPENGLNPSKSPFVIVVIGDDPLATILEDLSKGETFENRTIQVQRLSTLNETKFCQILFVSQSQKKRIPQILEAIRGKSVLTIGDTEDFASLARISHQD